MHQTLENILNTNKVEKYVGKFELPHTITQLIDIDEFNAAIHWYLEWKKTESKEKQNTCTIKDIFGDKEAVKVIIAINFYKYLRFDKYDPDIVERFLKLQ